MESNKNKLLTVGELAKKCGVTVRTLQYYDEKGLLIPSEYSDGGRRMYSKRDILRLQQIVFLKSMGFSLEDIRDRMLPAESAEELEQLFKEQKGILIEKIAHIQETVNDLDKIIVEVKQGSEIDIERLLMIVRATQTGNPFSFMARYIAKNQLEQLFNCTENEEAAEEFNKSLQIFSEELVELCKQNEKPEGVKGQKMAERWWHMMMSLGQGNTAYIKEMAAVIKNDNSWPSDVNELKETTNSLLRQAIIIYFKNNNIKLT